MAKFEVHIPATDGNGFNVTLKVGADNWMSALKAGMQKLGEQGTVSQNVMVDVQEDNSIHVTEAASGRVFRIRELTEDEVSRAQVKRPSQIRPAPARVEVKTEPGLPAVKLPDLDKTQPIPRGALEATRPAGEPLKIVHPPSLEKTQPATPAPANLTPAPRSQPRTNKSSARIELRDVEELVQPLKPTTGSIGRVKSSPNVARSQRQETEEILAEFEKRLRAELGVA